MEIQSVTGLGGRVFGSWEFYLLRFDGGWRGELSVWREVKYYMYRAKIPELGGLIMDFFRRIQQGYCLGSTSFV